jgi:hypothetical protein
MLNKRQTMSRYDNDKIYATYTWTDETSSFDPEGRWSGGSDAYWRDYRARVPRKMLERAEATHDFETVKVWIDNNSEKPIWR